MRRSASSWPLLLRRLLLQWVWRGFRVMLCCDAACGFFDGRERQLATNDGQTDQMSIAHSLTKIEIESSKGLWNGLCEVEVASQEAP